MGLRIQTAPHTCGKLFGNSERLLPYVECSTPDQNGQLQICIDKKVTGYPTWEFADGSRLSGEVSLQALRDKTGCSITTNVNATSSSELIKPSDQLDETTTQASQ